MRSVNLSKNKKKKSPWVLATLLMEHYLHTHSKIDKLFNAFIPSLEIEKRKLCKFLFYGAIRNKLRIEEALRPNIRKNPNELVLSILTVSGFEILASPEEKIRSIIHHAVEQSKTLVSPKEVQFINAVLRKLPKHLNDQDPAQSLATYYSHPHWLVDQWIKGFGRSETEALLKWNQSVPKIYLLAKALPQSVLDKIGARPFLVKNRRFQNTFKDLYTLSESSLQMPEMKQLLADGKGYIKDPSTLYAVEALNPQANECVLDLCAAPGGKSFDCLQRMRESGVLVSIDYKDARMKRLKENLATFRNSSLEFAIIDCDVLKLEDRTFTARGLPIEYDAVLLDVPCSNTGVIQRKPDVRWRLDKSAIDASAALQLKLLTAASRRLKDTGRLVYSTCSIDPRENAEVIKDFLASKDGQDFLLDTEHCFYPWIDKHDGAGVFRLVKKPSR